MPESKQDDGETSDRLDTAIQWWVRLDGGALSPSELAAFRAWLAGDPRNEAAFEEACDFWGSWQSLPQPAVQAYLASRRPERRRARIWPAMTIAAVAVAALFFAFDELWIMWRADIRTGIGEFRTVALPDGSRAHMNAVSALSFDYSGDKRRLTLLAGEAWFEVEKDPSRPFTVEAAGGTITARGTAFDVATNKARTEVTVGEHSVEVAAEGAAVVVEAGRQTAYGPNLPALEAYEADPERVTSWRRGKLIFKDKPLGDVIAALGRYHRRIVFIASADVRNRRVTGVFRVDQPLEAIRAIEAHLGVRSTRLSDYLIVLHS
ncbi:MAG: iron dicitrate transport regulator FecR [Methylocystaceae bacterium]|nr:MAG: iron dicitrate transport regulator FecR [Methylocystaceae bacterium]